MGSEEILEEKSEKYFNYLTTYSNDNIKSFETSSENLREKVSLRISITNIKKDYNYSLQIFSINHQNIPIPLNSQEELIKQSSSEVILKTSIIMDYYFEKEQRLLIEITKNKKEESQKFDIKTTLGCIIGSRKNTLKKIIAESSEEKLIIIAEKMGHSEEMLILDFEVKSNSEEVEWDKIKNKFIFKINSLGNNTPIYKSECISDTGVFNQVSIPACILNKGFNIQFINSSKDEILNISTNIKEMVTNKIITLNVDKNRNFILTSKSYIKKILTFIDYLKLGVQIGLSIAIDFTGSNGEPKSPLSLHYIYGKEPNQYERAINACGNIVAYYDYDQLFPCYGFGANINNIPKHIFNLNFEEDPNINLIPNVIEVYHNALNKVKLWGPTNFGPIIDTMINFVRKENNKLKYNILMILTDGMIDDVDYTINALVEASFLPISVIVIGIGKADFTTMNILDADINPLINDKGVKASRDLVQFVPFLKYENNPQLLAEEVLAEIPKQMVEYYEQNNIVPGEFDDNVKF